MNEAYDGPRFAAFLEVHQKIIISTIKYNLNLNSNSYAFPLTTHGLHVYPVPSYSSVTWTTSEVSLTWVWVYMRVVWPRTSSCSAALITWRPLCCVPAAMGRYRKHISSAIHAVTSSRRIRWHMWYVLSYLAVVWVIKYIVLQCVSKGVAAFLH